MRHSFLVIKTSSWWAVEGVVHMSFYRKSYLYEKRTRTCCEGFYSLSTSGLSSSDQTIPNVPIIWGTLLMSRLCRAVMCIDERLCTWKVTVPGENKIQSICAKMFPCRVSNKFAQNIRTTFFDLLYSIHNSFEAFWNDTLKAKKNSQYDTGSIATGGHLLGCITQRSILDYPHILRSWHHSYNRNELFRA